MVANHSVVHPLHFCNGEWHKIQVTKRRNIVQIQVDENPAITSYRSTGSDKSVDISDPLYVGGLPGTVTNLFIS